MQPSSPKNISQDTLAQAWTCQQQGDVESAERLCKKVLRKFPANFEALHLLALLALDKGQLNEARKLAEQALRINPRSARAHSALGAIFREQDQHEEALAYFQHALSLEEDDAQTHYNLGNTLSDLARLTDAVASYDQAIRLQPMFVEARRNRGILFHQLGRYGEALDSLNQAIALDPNLFTAIFTRGKTFLALEDLTTALEDFDKAVSLQPNNPEVHNVRGIALRKLGRLDDALASFQLATLLDSNYAGAHWNEGLCRLTLGDWSRETWQKYEWGWEIGQRQPKRHFDRPIWLGHVPIAGKTILLHDEQGFGDTIQFARFASSVASLGATVILTVQPDLKHLMSTLAGPAHVISIGEQQPHFDYHCPLLSLPLALGITLDNLPSYTSYLQADEERIAFWQKKLKLLDDNKRNGDSADKTLRVGIVWSGNSIQIDDGYRSMPLHDLVSIETPLIELVSLQKVVRETDQSVLAEHPAVLHVGSSVEDFSDTAALIMQMDLVVSVCTSVAHLSAALGKPTWVLLSHNADWRWLRGRDDTPWYPTATLFRQTRPGNWVEVIERVKKALHQLSS